MILPVNHKYALAIAYNMYRFFIRMTLVFLLFTLICLVIMELLMNDTGSNRDSSADLRDDILQVPSLWELFVEKTVADSKNWFAARTSSPPWGVVIGLIAATIFFGFLKSYIAILSAVFSLGLLIWIIFIRTGKTQSSLESILTAANNGDFPFELKDSIIKRLRWWSVLIVPIEWTKNSRIFSIRDKLHKRLKELEDEILYWKSPEGLALLAEVYESEEAIRVRHQENQKKLNLLKSRGVNVNDVITNDDKDRVKTQSERFNDPEKLIKYLRGKGECERQLNRISRISEPVERATEEIVLVQALLMHCDRVINMIEEVEGLQVSIDTIKADNFNDKIKETIGILEKRRSLVGKLNRISPKKIIGVVDYEPIRAQSEISKERMFNGK